LPVIRSRRRVREETAVRRDGRAGQLRPEIDERAFSKTHASPSVRKFAR
jgi:hypothetical protein